MPVVVAIDAGTTGVRAFAVDDGTAGGFATASSPSTSRGPAGSSTTPTRSGRRCRRRSPSWPTALDDQPIAAIGITDQRETTVVWDRRTGRPLHRAIVWQDRRTAARCDELRDAGHLALVRDRTGLVLDPYFSGTKLEWLLTEGGVEASADLAFGTVDSWVLWNLTGGAVHATEPSNASRTMLYDIRVAGVERRAAASCFGVPHVVPARGAPVERPVRRHGRRHGRAAGIPVSGIAGDQQAALFGQACVRAGHDQEHLRHRLASS